ncbi:BA14K family protein [Stappia sp. ES.058]|uniref:BA14K family protein n=1 Tax=Stappia sp. ES.058 TaxID=1881061 RepID=UPI00087A2FD8|nr:BA14K family protein [Stappia sp. ES.058]SDU27491.1 BA14K-like protein [Stappia sp. ES.058]
MSLVPRFAGLRLALAGALAIILSLPLAPQRAAAQPDTVLQGPYTNRLVVDGGRHYRHKRTYRHNQRRIYRPHRAYRPYRGQRGYRAYRPYRPYRNPRYGSGVYFGYGGNGAAAAGIIGLATGLIAQQALTSRRYAPPARRGYRGAAAWTPEWYAYCARKYRSFNPRTGYYLAYSGRYRFCR